MPAQARSLRITEAYRGRMAGLRDRAKAEAKRTWARVDIDALDATWNPGMLVLATTQLQREAARLSAGYLAAYVSSEKGERVELPPAVALDAGKVWTGSSLTKAFRGAVIGTKIAIADGKLAADAYVEGGQALVQTAGLAVDDVCREALRIAMEQSPDIEGYQRAVKGTCQACMGAADGVITSIELPLSIHPNCVCVSEPSVKPEQASNKLFGNRTMPDLFRSYTAEGPVRPDPTKFWSADQIETMYGYVGTHDSYALNAALRGNRTLTAGMKKLRDGLDRLMDHVGPIGKPVRVYRGLSGTPEELGLKEGESFLHEGFASAASTRRYAEEFIVGHQQAGRTGKTVLDMDVDPRVRAIWGSNPKERELVMERGIRYIVRSVKKERGGWSRVRVNVVPG